MSIISKIVNQKFTVISDKFNIKKVKEDKAIPVTGHEGPLGCETSRVPHFL
jgi:uncharacterized protein YxjI